MSQGEADRTEHEQLNAGFTQARAFHEAGQNDQAIKLLNQMIIRWPGQARLHEVMEAAVSARRATRDQSFPVHFFTIVLNGMPFIQYHLDVFRSLPFPWTWHIIEGVASMNKDSAWPLKYGGQIPDDCHANGLSNDGTTEYLNEIAEAEQQRVVLYRPQPGKFWHSKTEMVQMPIWHKLWREDDCLLWQVDSDELWRRDQIVTMRQAFVDNPEKTAAVYRALYFVGEKLVIDEGYHGAHLLWPRTWRYRPGLHWYSHAPPILAQWIDGKGYASTQKLRPFDIEQCDKLVGQFQHYAYVTPEQIGFKASYYGYKGLVEKWQAMQQHQHFPVKLKEYLPYHWVPEEAPIMPLAQSRHRPLAWREEEGWCFANGRE